MTTLALEGITREQGGRVVLRDVHLAPKPGEIHLLEGPSGSGKTTVLQVLGLLEAPSRGRVLVDGRDAWALSADARAALRLRHVGHVFQTNNMMPRLTLLENVMLPMRLARRADAARARGLLESLGVGALADKLPHEVSVGERQRASFARALANEPDVLLADEPTASLDEENARRIADLLRYAGKEGRAVVVATHDPRLRHALDGAATRWLVDEGRLTRVA